MLTLIWYRYAQNYAGIICQGLGEVQAEAIGGDKYAPTPLDSHVLITHGVQIRPVSG